MINRIPMYFLYILQVKNAILFYVFPPPHLHKCLELTQYLVIEIFFMLFATA